VEFIGSGASRFFMPNGYPTLTLKQERFARKYVALGNASEAYRLVYNAENMKDATIWRKASELLDNGKVAAMIDKVKSEQSDFQAITFEEIGGYLRRAVDGATAAGQHGAASQAAVALGKLAGLYVEKQKVSVDDAREHLDAVQTLADEPDDDEPEQKVVNFR
tara:strand:- start:7485 stop:7973 length:489 start_codon:yes stop_codon:yes gene_type:complete